MVEQPEPSLPVLHVIPFSHFNEKAMWVLDLKGIPYHLCPLVDPSDRSEIKRVTAGRSFTTPVLRTADQVLTDSTEIALWAERERPQPPLLPTDPALRSECLFLEDWADEVLGPHARRWLFGQLMFQDPARGKAFFLTARPAWQRPLLWPLAKRFLGRALHITPTTVRASEQALRRGLTLLDERLEGRAFLVGERLSLADVAVAALLGPLTMTGDWTRAHPRTFAWRRELLETCGRRPSLTDAIPEAEERARRGAAARERLEATAS